MTFVLAAFLLVFRWWHGCRRSALNIDFRTPDCVSGDGWLCACAVKTITGKDNWGMAEGDNRVVMMTNGPAIRIGEDRAVSLARPRNRIEAIDTPEYAEARSAVIHFLHERYRNPGVLAA